jgi:hypothetical protein
MATITRAALAVAVLILTAAGFVACAVWEATEAEPDDPPALEAPPALPVPPALRTVVPRKHPERTRKPTETHANPRRANPYRGAAQWCGTPFWQDTPCRVDDDCADALDPAGLRTFCRHPRWALQQHVDVKQCRAGRYGPDRKQYMRDRLRVYVDHICEPPDWWESEVGCWRYRSSTAAKCEAKRYCDPDDLHSLLRVVAQRESNWKPYAEHARNPDVRANRSAWAKYAKRYRWRVEMDEHGEVVEQFPTLPGFNRYYGDRLRWKGLGWYGQNTPLWIPAWDRNAPPEAFCREVPSSEAYMRTARSVWRRINKGRDCNGDGEKDWYGSGVLEDGTVLPTWADVHQGASVGKLCPRQKSHDLFAKRSSKIDLDPDEPIRLTRLGERIEPGRQNLVAAWLRVRMNLIPRP